MSTEVTKYDEAFAKMAAQYASGERVSGSFISLKGGMLTFGEEQMPGNQICCVILDYVEERRFYTEKYSPESSSPPRCYAFQRVDEPSDDMGPHLSMQTDLTYFQPQHATCKGCRNDEWGTADTGRGKSCGERRRLALLPAGYYTPRRGSRDFDLNFITDPEHYAAADIALLSVPVMSVKHLAKYVVQLQASLRRPPLAVVTRISVEPDQKSQFAVKFEMIEQLPSEMYEVIMKRHEEAKASIIFGWPAPSGEAAQGAPGAFRR